MVRFANYQYKALLIYTHTHKKKNQSCCTTSAWLSYGHLHGGRQKLLNTTHWKKLQNSSWKNKYYMSSLKWSGNIARESGGTNWINLLLRKKLRIFRLFFFLQNNRDEEESKLFRLPPGYIWGERFLKAWVCALGFYWKDKIKPSSLADSSLAAVHDLGHYLWPDDLLGCTMKMPETCQGFAI